MKKLFIPALIFCGLLAGCASDFRIGGGSKTDSTTSNNSTSNNSTTNNSQHPTAGEEIIEPTVGQQLIDLKKARDSGAITEAEYEAEKAKLLNEK
ncbi:MAG TPA: SHOCT domain-containing protein [Pseudomonadales bacterium]|nr:SHOCT domain-containing protein [Pseudomonadales bacterium]